LLFVLRQLERWLHQHIFKVGWLITKSFQTTTIFYYTFFLPGVFLHEVSYWLAAGMLNVHAKGSIRWPEPQEIAELDLSFVEISKNITPVKLALITLAPIIAGLISVWFIANNILNFNIFFNTLSTGELSDVATAFQSLASAPDFWLWIYFLFTISNTMIPKMNNLRGLRMVFIAIGVVIVFLFVIGVGNQVILGTLAEPIAQGLGVLTGTFVIIILINLFFVVVLGTIEAVIERITGDSATFRRGKLVAMTRQELIELRQRQNRREARALQSRNEARQGKSLSIYSRELSVPGGPGTEPVTQSSTVIVETPEQPALPRRDDRAGPELITGSTSGMTSIPVRKTLALPESSDDDDIEEPEDVLDEFDEGEDDSLVEDEESDEPDTERSI
jgi:hypothetical protein